MTLALAPGSVVAGAKRIEFRFNRTDGVVSGFRVLAFNFLQIDGERVLPRKHFSRRIRSNGPPPLTGQKEIAEGQRLWQSASLRASSLAGAPAIRAHCGDCHARDGSDLKYFNYSNQSIIARSQFHGLSEQEGRQIASYIRVLDAPHPGRPWNPLINTAQGCGAGLVRHMVVAYLSDQPVLGFLCCCLIALSLVLAVLTPFRSVANRHAVPKRGSGHQCRRLRRLTKRTAGPVPDCNPFTAERYRRMEGDV